MVVRTVTEEVEIPYRERVVDDPSRPVGTRTVTTQGMPGTKTRTFSVTYTDGRETDRELVSEVVVTPPTDHVVAVGTKVEAPDPPDPPPDEPDQGGGCDPNYSGCVPIASDVDCAGGSGDGPEYVAGPVDVIGSDRYGLDRDNDGVGCE